LADLSINEYGADVPRRYTLGKRAETKAETRARIVAATLRLYQEMGVAEATVPAIARAADVAPATVRNHFPTSHDLAEATALALLADLRMPDASIFEGATSLTERVDRLLGELVAFFERGTDWWRVREADRMSGDAWSAPETRYYELMGGLIAAAIAPLDEDPAVVGIVGIVLVQGYFTARGAGRSAQESMTLIRSLLMPWLESRLGTANDPRGANPASMPPSGHDRAR
jgi:AcrR family transcriptional regulator